MKPSVLDTTCIRWDSLSKDYAVTIGGEFVGARRTHPEATELRNEEQLKRIKAETKAVTK